MKTLAIAMVAAVAAVGLAATQDAPPVPPPVTQYAMFGAGCFWGVEATFRQVPGVVSTAVGFSGGKMAAPTYAQVCSGRTGHAEVVLVEYNPARVTYEELLRVFWQNHDPTTPNRQGPDIGEQYRSVVFYYSPEQRAAAQASKNEAQKLYRAPIVTQILPAGPFYLAEEYHQQYLEKRGLASCHIR